MLGWARPLVPVVALVLGACSTPPDEVTVTGDPSSSGTSVGASTTVTPGTTVVDEGSAGTATGETGTGTTRGGAETTMGAVETTTADASSSSSSSGPPPGCMGPEDCGSNEECVGDRCVEACGGTWGAGSYGYCLTEYGAFDTMDACGEDHLCVYWGGPITNTACSRQGCVEACDCPPPADTGTATVACGQITVQPELTDCYLSCAKGETCPDGMTCMGNGACANDVPPHVPIYGDCGNLAAPCEVGFCMVTPGGQTQCTMECILPGDCPAVVPEGGNANVACSDVSPGTLGFECYLSCIGGLTCPNGMTCVNGTLCAWPA